MQKIEIMIFIFLLGFMTGFIIMYLIHLKMIKKKVGCIKLEYREIMQNLLRTGQVPIEEVKGFEKSGGQLDLSLENNSILNSKRGKSVQKKIDES